MAQRYLRAQFRSQQDGFLQISHGDIFKVVARSKLDGTLEAINVFTEEHGRIPRPSEAVYVEVAPTKLAYIQPVMLVGSLRHYIQEMLLAKQPDTFATPVPHTTRPMRANEQNGVDYVFVKENTMMQMIKSNLFIYCGQLNGNYYGTTEAMIRTIAQREKKHCILDVSSSITRLFDRKIYPLVVFVGAQDWMQLRDLMQLEGYNELQAQKEFEKDAQELQRTEIYLNGLVIRSNLTEAYAAVNKILQLNSATAWIPEVGVRNDNQRLV